VFFTGMNAHANDAGNVSPRRTLILPAQPPFLRLRSCASKDDLTSGEVDAFTAGKKPKQ
jgi:hypothetical protein